MMLELVIPSRRTDLGHGLYVQRLLPSARRRMVGPFIFFDHAGPVRLDPQQGRLADVRPHPHIGLATVSYLLSSAVTHRDSLGIRRVIRPGDVNWMTAGRGITHSERFDEPDAFAGQGLELLQSWVALPVEDETCEPAFDHYPVQSLPCTEGDGLWMRLIAGEVFDLASPVETRSPMFYLHARLAKGTTLPLPENQGERAAYIVSGGIECDGQAYAEGHMLVFKPTGQASVKALSDCTLMLLGGEPVGERHIWWNFVSSDPKRIEQAKADWRAGRMPLPPGDDQEYIPLPD